MALVAALRLLGPASSAAGAKIRVAVGPHAKIKGMRSFRRFFSVGARDALGRGVALALFFGLALAASAADAGEPLKVIASLRARNLEATLAMIKEYVPVPLHPDSLIAEVFGDMSGQVALAAPVDVLIGVDGARGESSDDNPPLPMVAFSVGIKNLDEAQKQAQSRGYVTGGNRGAALLRLPIGSRGLYCLLSGPPGPAFGRLLCSRDERGRDAMASQLGRLSATVPQTDLHGELLVDVLADAYKVPWQRALQVAALILPQKLQLGQPTFDRALTDTIQMLVEQCQAMSKDLQTLKLDLNVSKGGIEARLSYHLGGQNSFWAQAEADAAATPPTGAPPLFWSLPLQSSSASFHKSHPKYFRKVLAPLLPLLDGFVTYDNLPAADRQALMEVFRKVLDVTADSAKDGTITTVMTSGQSSKSAASGNAAGDSFDPMALLQGNYYVVASEGAIDWTIPWLKSLVTVYNRPGIQAYLRTKWKKLDAHGIPPTLKVDASAKTLGPGAYAVSLSGNFAAPAGDSKGGASGKLRPLNLYMAVVPVAGRLWTAMAPDRATVLQKLGEHLKKSAEKTLAEREGLQTLHDPAIRSGGYTSLMAMSGYLDAILAAVAQRSSRGGAQTPRSAQLFSMIPHHGEIPMTYVSRSAKPPGLEHSSEFTLYVPRMVIEDIAALILQIALEK